MKEYPFEARRRGGDIFELLFVEKEMLLIFFFPQILRRRRFRIGGREFAVSTSTFSLIRLHE